MSTLHRHILTAHGGTYGVCTLVALLRAASAPLDLLAAPGAGSVEKLPLPALAT